MTPLNRYTGACIGVCKYVRSGPLGAEHCIGCSMTEAQKEAFTPMPDDAARLAYLEQIRAQQLAMGGFDHWPQAYTEKCIRKDAPVPRFVDDAA